MHLIEGSRTTLIDVKFSSESIVRTKMSINSKKEFKFLIGEADEIIKEDFYSRLMMIEEGLSDKKLVATSNKNVFQKGSLAEILRGVVLNAPNQEFYDDAGHFIGSISLPSDLGDFLSTYCKGSTNAAYQLLKELKIIAKHSPGEPMQKSLDNISPIIYLIDSVDRQYKFHIGNNPKYSNRETKSSDVGQLFYSKIYPANGSKEDVENFFLEYFNKLFEQEPTPTLAYELGPMLNGYCQYCHRPNIAKRKFCSTHAFDESGNNSQTNSVSNAFQKAFRNLGGLLHDEQVLIKDHPTEYIKLAKKIRETEARKHERLRIVQNQIKSEYFIKLEGWAKHHPLYQNFYNIILKSYTEYNETLNSIDWSSSDCIKLISKILKIANCSNYISSRYIPETILNVAPKNIKPLLLGPCGLDIECKLHKDITIEDWITMLCRSFQYQLVLACKNKNIAAYLAYIKFD